MDGDQYNTQDKYMTIKRAPKKSTILTTISTEKVDGMKASPNISSTSNSSSRLQEENIEPEAVYKHPEEATSNIEVTQESLSKLKLETVIADVDKPGHINNLTVEQTKQLYILWDHLLDVVDDKMSSEKSEGSIHQKSNDSKDPNSSPSMSLQAQEGDHHSTLPRAHSSPILDAVSDPDLLSNKTSVTSLSSTYSQNDGFSTASETMASANAPKRLVTYSEELWRGFLVGHTDPDATLLRFLRARKWNLATATTMLIATADWRAKSGIFSLVRTGEQGLNQKLLESGKTFFHGVDKDGHLIIYVIASKHDKNAQTMEENEKFTIHCMETARKLLSPTTETVTLIFDLSNFSMANMDFPSVKFLANCFQSYYPESLGKCFIVGAPWIFWTCWKLIRPLLDPVVAGKIHFVKKEELGTFIDEYTLDRVVGGKNPYTYSYIPPTSEELSMHAFLSTTSIGSSTSEPQLEYQTIKEDYEKFRDEFVTLTRKICKALEPIEKEEELKKAFSEEPLSSLIQERQELKVKLNEYIIKLDALTLPKTYYTRLGIYDSETGLVDWSKAKGLDQDSSDNNNSNDETPSIIVSQNSDDSL